MVNGSDQAVAGQQYPTPQRHIMPTSVQLLSSIHTQGKVRPFLVLWLEVDGLWNKTKILYIFVLHAGNAVSCFVQMAD